MFSRAGINIFLFTILVACFSPSAKLLEVERRELANISIPGSANGAGIYYVPGNATIQNCIQVVSYSGNSEHVLKNYKLYNVLGSYKLVNDTSLMLIVSDTISYLGNRPDTFFLVLK
jgi:hypothetical protein